MPNNQIGVGLGTLRAGASAENEVRQQNNTYRKLLDGKLVNDDYYLKAKSELEKKYAAETEREKEALEKKATQMALQRENAEYALKNANQKRIHMDNRAAASEQFVQEKAQEQELAFLRGDNNKKSRKEILDSITQETQLRKSGSAEELQAIKMRSGAEKTAAAETAIRKSKEREADLKHRKQMAIDQVNKSSLSAANKAKEIAGINKQFDEAIGVEETQQKQARKQANTGLAGTFFGNTNIGKFVQSIKNTATGEGGIDKSELMKGLANNVAKIGEALTAGISEAISVYTQYAGMIEARLQDSGKSWSEASEKIVQTIGMSGIVSQKKTIENLKNLVEQGIVYNLEQRAFLATVSENIVSTFKATRDSLTRLVRIQQADTTAARLGLESYLQRFLNNLYKDNSYLNSTYGAVADALLETNALLGASDSTNKGYQIAVEFEYIVQKWLGSLESVGVGSDTLTQIAKSVNAIQTGDVEYMNSNENIQRLIVSAANQANLNYGEIFNEGLSNDEVNELLKSIVLVLKDIRSNSGSNVVLQSLSKLYGVSIADMSAIVNMDNTTIDTVFNSAMTYANTLQEVNAQLNAMSDRIPLGQKMQTVFDNFQTFTGNSIATSKGWYTTWAINEFIEKATGGINIPFVSAVGTGVDVNANVNQLAKLLIVGAKTLTQIGDIRDAISSGVNLSLANWEASEYNTRGSGKMSTPTGVMQNVSESISSGSEKDTMNNLVEEASKDAKKQANEEKNKEKSVNDLYEMIYNKKKPIHVEVDNASAFNSTLKITGDNAAINIDNSQQIIADITALQTEVQALQNTEFKVRVMNETLPVAVAEIGTEIRNDIKSYIQSAIGSLLASAIRDAFSRDTGSGSAESVNVFDQLIDKLINDAIDVRVRNTGFDEFLQVSTFPGG